MESVKRAIGFLSSRPRGIEDFVKQKGARTREMRLYSNLRWGVGHGLAFSSILSAVVLVASGFSGKVVVRGHTLATYRVVLAYLVAGMLAGIVLGLSRNLTKSRPAYVLIGAAAGVLVYMSIAILAFGLPMLDLGVVLLGAGMGGVVGFFLYP